MSANGGPAFPLPRMVYENHIDGPQVIRESAGMTLLDYMAGQALCGMMANTNCLGKNGLFNDVNFKTCYDAAAAMLAEKAKREAQP